MRLILSKSGSIVSRGIRWINWGDYSHASFLSRDNQVIEAVWRKVRMLPFEDWQKKCKPGSFKIFTVETNLQQSIDVWNFALEQVGKKYDLTGDLHFLTRTDYAHEPDDRWFCSELVTYAFAQAGVQLFARTEAWRVYPDLLQRSVLVKDG